MSPTRFRTALLSLFVVAIALSACGGGSPTPNDEVARASDLATRLATG